jgi:Fe-S oxidoreductase/nitrate reductase gamma subunit
LFNALELLMVVLALGVIVVGLSRRWRLSGIAAAEDRRADWPGMLAAVLGQRKILARPLVGLAHLCLVWGFIIYILIVLVAQTPVSMSSSVAFLISLVLDLAGVSMLAATVFFLVRRITRLLKKADARPPKRTLLPLGLLLIILISGFLAEAARLNILANQPFLAAPAGWLFSNIAPAAPQFMQAMIRVHFVFIILFLITLPFTFMRHLGATTVHLLYKQKEPAHLPRPLSLSSGPLGAAAVADLSPAQRREAQACVSCGRCDEHCPALISGKPLSPRTIIGNIADQMASWPRRESDSKKQPRLDDTISDDEIWACTTCLACVSHCPASIRPMDKVLEMRRGRVLNQGTLPGEALTAIRNLELFGDVNGKGVAHKSDWALNRDVARIRSKQDRPEVLLWVGCSGAFHPEYQETARSLVKLLKAARVDFAILDHEELCCGDPARKLGDEALFLELARTNIRILKQYGVQRIVTLCPHCFNTLGEDYAQLGLEAEVQHAAQLVDSLIQQGRIQFKYPYPKSVVVHDPCYLGRYHGIYAPLRRIAGQVPGASVKEAPRNMDKGFCCGGGGGRMWLHETLGEKINHLRTKELMDTHADTIATACPYCLTMMSDGVGAIESGKKPDVIDIIKLAADALG